MTDSFTTTMCDGVLHRINSVIMFFWCPCRAINVSVLAISFSLGTDGMLLALSDHGFERSG